MEKLTDSETPLKAEAARETLESERKTGPSAEARARMSESKTGEKNPMYGRRGESHPGYGRERPPEVKAQISRALRGREVPPETRAKISEAKKGEKHPRYNQNIDKVRAAIGLHIGGASMRRASLEMGFDPNWLSVFRCRNPERFAKILTEELNVRDRRAAERDLGRMVVGLVTGNGPHPERPTQKKTDASRLKGFLRRRFSFAKLQDIRQG